MKKSEIFSPYYQLQRKRQKTFYDCSQKSIDDFNLIVVNPPQKLPDKGKRSIANSFGSYSQYQSI